MNAHLIIFTLALVGVGEALYLIYERKKKRLPVCVIGTSCETVWRSPYSRTFGVENETLGIIFYTVIAMVEGALLLLRYDPLLVLGESIILAGGAVMSCYFVYVQWRIIKAWCFWCVLSAIIVWVMVAVHFLV